MTSPSLTRRTVLAAGIGTVGTAAGCAAASQPGSSPSPQPARSTQPSGAAQRTMLRFVVASDGHHGEPNTDSARFLGEFVAAVNSLHASSPLDVVVINGDIGHGGIKLLGEAKAALDDLDVAYLVTQGNHDEVSPAQWKQVWGTEENQVRRFAGRSMILLNTSDIEGRYLCADRDWLASALEAESGQDDLFVFMHITPRTWTAHGINCPRIRSLLAGTANVRAVFNAHDHDQDGIRTDAGLPYLFDAHYGGSWGTQYRGFRVVEVTPGRLTTAMRTVDGAEFPPKALNWN